MAPALFFCFTGAIKELMMVLVMLESDGDDCYYCVRDCMRRCISVCVCGDCEEAAVSDGG